VSKRVAARTAAALVVLLLATFSTARARQVWNEHQAQSRVDLARAGALGELQYSVRVGVLATELAPYRLKLRQIEGSAPPASSPLWDTESQAFYSHQAKQYQRLTRWLRLAIVKSATIARADLSAAVSLLTETITSAKKLLLDVSIDSSILAGGSREAENLKETPAQLRVAAGSVAADQSKLSAALTAKRQTVEHMVEAVHGSLPTLLAQADSEAASAHASLDLLSIVSKPDAKYGAQVDAGLAAVHAQADVFSAALHLDGLQSAVNAVQTHFTSDLPAKVVVVSTEDQEARMYQGGKLVDSTPVTTGGPELPTDRGIFHIYAKVSPFTFHSPWPPSSPFYYPPSPVSYWMPFDGAQGLHDAPWRANFGPGSNLAPTNLGGHYILGTHGCVNMPPAAAQFLWNWAPIGTTVVVI
jgi:lipoprotein-anchoring transpeptidase ErfK/SrfK